MNFSDNIKSKAKELIRKADELTRINVKWEKPIVIKCGTLDTKDILKKSAILDVFEEHKKKPAVYYFEITSSHTGPELIEALQLYKIKKERSCPKIDRKRDLNTKYLYCGSRKEGLHGRFIQHLGFGSKDTFALQLLYWAKHIQLELMFHYAWLDPNYTEFTELVESALTDKLEPLVGKKA